MDEEEASRGVALILRSTRRLYFIVPRKRFRLEGKSIDRSIDHRWRSRWSALVYIPRTVTTSEYEFLLLPLPTFRHVLENLVKRHTYLLTLLEEFLISLFLLFEINRISLPRQFFFRVFRSVKDVRYL